MHAQQLPLSPRGLLFARRLKLDCLRCQRPFAPLAADLERHGRLVGDQEGHREESERERNGPFGELEGGDGDSGTRRRAQQRMGRQVRRLHRRRSQQRPSISVRSASKSPRPRFTNIPRRGADLVGRHFTAKVRIGGRRGRAPLLWRRKGWWWRGSYFNARSLRGLSRDAEAPSPQLGSESEGNTH